MKSHAAWQALSAYAIVSLGVKLSSDALMESPHSPGLIFILLPCEGQQGQGQQAHVYPHAPSGWLL